MKWPYRRSDGNKGLHGTDMTENDIICDVRIPTYQRPKLLKRALESILAQSEPRWRATVFDDSPNRDGEAVVSELQDPRLVYVSNAVRGGASGNIDNAFRTDANEVSEFAFVLEDDNSVDPDFIRENIALMNITGADIVLRNQNICLDDDELVYRDTGNTTRGDVFQDGWLSPLELRAGIFFGEGISNGGLFWRPRSRNNLFVGPTVVSAAIQEHVRTLHVSTPIVFAAEPLASFSLPVSGETLREPLENRRFNRARQSILRHLLKLHGADIVEAAKLLARNDEMKQRLDLELANLLRLPQSAKHPVQSVKGLAKLLTMKDPLNDYWQKQSA